LNFWGQCTLFRQIVQEGDGIFTQSVDKFAKTLSFRRKPE